MNLKTFKAICTYLLNKHYDVQLNDTHYSIDTVVQRELAYNIRPFEALNEYAEDFKIHRTDVQEKPGKFIKLTLAEEQRALLEVLPRVVTSSRIKNCICGSRTMFRTLQQNHQHHTCMNRACGREFIEVEKILVEEEAFA